MSDEKKVMPTSPAWCWGPQWCAGGADCTCAKPDGPPASAASLRDQRDRAVALLRRYVDAEFDEDPIAYEARAFLDEIDKPG